MKASALILSVAVSFLLLTGLPTVALAQRLEPLPEPSTFLIWAGIAGAGGIYWWHRNRQN